jgi:CheY-like chemotaxis protein
MEAADGIKGLEMIQQQKPWMIMLDFLLPRMSGFEVYESLQQNPELRRIPLILMSGRKEEVTSKIPEPFEDKHLVFVEKPFEQKELIAAIKKAMVLAQKLPPLSVIPAAAPVVETAPAHTDDQLAKRIQELEARQTALEQQLANQQKQFQQLVDFIKKKLK